MPDIGELERKTQKRIVRLFTEGLGYAYLGNWIDRPDNSNIEPALLSAWLHKRGIDEVLVKRTLISVSEGIRQNLDSKKKEFIEHFFSTMQWVMAGNDTEGLRYGTIQTPEKYSLNWKEEGPGENRLDKALNQVCAKARFLEL